MGFGHCDEDMASSVQGNSSKRPRAIEKSGLLIGAMQIWLLCKSLGPGGVDLFDQIKGFLDLRLTAGQFLPDAITDINHHYVLDLDRSLTLEVYYSGEFREEIIGNGSK